ncbi:hypothetical protein [Mycetocola reblochoni]
MAATSTDWLDHLRRRAAVVAARYSAAPEVHSGVLEVSGPPHELALNGTFVIGHDARLETMISRLTVDIVADVEEAVGVMFAHKQVDVVVAQPSREPVIDLPSLAISGAGARSGMRDELSGVVA